MIYIIACDKTNLLHPALKYAPMSSNNLVLLHFNNIEICLKTVTSNQLLVIIES